MYTANSLVRFSKEQTGRILGTWRQYLVNVNGLRYSKQIEFQEELVAEALSTRSLRSGAP